MYPKGWVISRRGDRFVVTFENTNQEAVIVLTPGQLAKLGAEATEKAGNSPS